MVTAKLIIVGDEILNGRVQDVNGPFLTRRLHDLGIAVCSVCTIPDRAEAMKQTIKEALEGYDIVITSGGLGPTPDDLTKCVASKLLGKRLVLDEAVLARIEKHFEATGHKMPAASTKQALVPQGAIALENPVGLAPGLILPCGDTMRHRVPSQPKRTLILLPGVPLELQKIFESGVAPYLEETYFLSPMLVTVIRTIGAPESEIVERVSTFLARHRTIQVAYLPTTTGVDIRLSTEKDRKELTECQDEIKALLKTQIYAFDNASMEEVVGELLRKRRLTLSTAESCTGGSISDHITDVPGSSDYFRGGVVAYSNDHKKSLLGVTETVLRKHGAVSPECVIQMATGARERFGSDYALAVSGIAGPAGGTEAKPVGLVYVGLAGPKKTEAEELRLTGSRRMIKAQSAVRALDILRRKLME
jgi:nicotinamide-nucleotide amidase